MLPFQFLLFPIHNKREVQSERQVSNYNRVYPIGVFFIAWIVYCLSSVLTGHFQALPFDYFGKLVHTFLQRRLYLVDPPIVHDLTLHNGRWYVPFPPLPALLMVPWLWVFGGINSTIFSVTAGAINVALVFILLQALQKHKWTRLKTSDNLWLSFFFGFGIAHWYLSTIGAVWFASHICTVTFMLLAVWLGITCRSPLSATFALSIAMLARPNVVLAYPLLLGCMSVQRQRYETETVPSSFIKMIPTSMLPIAISIGLLLSYNYLRFDSFFDFGYYTQNVARGLSAELHEYGQFDLHFVKRNLYVMLFALPLWSAKLSFFAPNPEGMSLLITSPALIYLYRARLSSLVAIGAWIATALLLVPLVMYYNTGRDQFGYRLVWISLSQLCWCLL